MRALADAVPRSIPGPVGFACSDVVERENSVGEDALHVTAHMAPDAQLEPGALYTGALVAVQDALIRR